MNIDEANKLRLPEGYRFKLLVGRLYVEHDGKPISDPRSIEDYMATVAMGVAHGFLSPVVLDSIWATYDGVRIKLQRVPLEEKFLLCYLASPDKLVMCDNISEWSYDVGIDLATHPEDWHSCSCSS
jgi:hypothetical protein